MVAADINNDGKMDVVGVGGNATILNWYENEGLVSPVFTKRTIDTGPLSLPVSVGVGDLDRDGDPDLVLGTNTQVHAYRNNGGSPLSWSKATLASGTVSSGDHVFVVNLEDDLDGDDDLDILVAEASTIPWWENLLPHSDIRIQLSTSEDGTTWSAWQGPEGRTTSSYTESAGETVTVNSGRYLQYRVHMRTHNSTSLNVRLSMVRLEPANGTYPNDAPTIQNVTGTSFTEITAFKETIGSGNQGLVRYQISNDGSNWYYHNGSRWSAATNSVGQTNTAAEVNARITSFDNDVGTGSFHFRAFLISDGAQQVILDQITIDYSSDPQVASTPQVAPTPQIAPTPQVAPTPQGSDVTPRIIASKKDYKLQSDADFDFEYTTKQRLQNRGKWKQEYELYEEKIERRRERLKTRRVRKNFRKARRRLAKANESVETFVYDAQGKLTDIEGEIEELREGRFNVKLPRKRARRPGKYKLQVKLVKDGVTYIEEKEFTWGVLAINIDKSFYLPNENSSIAIGVLDDAGLMVCDADVTLEIVDPLGGKTTLTTADTTIKISPQCEFYGVTDLPDYYTNYQVSVLGDYVMNLTAVTENGVRSIQDNFEVVAAVDFDVTRSGPTRIYPPVLYRMKFTVKANKGHSGPVKEYVPDSFVITPQEGMTVTTVGDAKVLTWNDETFVPGGTYDISYEFDAPDISPEFYLLGPLEIGAWKEGRQWQIANDAPNLTISSKVVDTNRVPFSGVGVDANLTDHDKTTKIIYAIEVDTGGNGDFRSPDNTTWSFRVNGGAWTQLTSASTPAKLIAAGDATFIDNETVSAGERIVNTACAGGFTPSLREHETGNPLSASSRVRNDECSETQASIDLSAAAFGDDFEFKIDQVENSGTEELIGLAHVIIAIGPPAQLAFSEQPTNTLSTASISPAIKVQVQDVDANLVTTATDSITLAINNNPVLRHV